jgi:toxin ParE1/3/4
MPIKWLRTALRNLDDHANYIAEDNPDAARRAAERVHTAVSRLAEYPNMGRIDRSRKPANWLLPVHPGSSSTASAIPSK